MPWTTPKTWWLEGELVNASDMNTYIRDNLLVAGVEQVTAADSLIYGTAANRVNELAIGSTGSFLVVDGGGVKWGQPVGQTVKQWIGTTTLTDSMNELGWGAWGTETATITNPGVKVKLWALLSGWGSVRGTDTASVTRIKLSVDGGTSWFDSSLYAGGCRFLSDESPVSVVEGAASTERTPTGDIKARVMVRTFGEGVARVYDGRLTLMAFGTT